jgi:hypothetical protein
VSQGQFEAQGILIKGSSLNDKRLTSKIEDVGFWLCGIISSTRICFICSDSEMGAGLAS